MKHVTERLLASTTHTFSQIKFVNNILLSLKKIICGHDFQNEQVNR